MNAEKLLKGLKTDRIYGKMPTEINFVTDNSSKVIIGSLFICRNGNNFKGEDYAMEALKKGAVAVMGEKEVKSPCFIKVKDIHFAAVTVLNNFYDFPQKRLDIVGVVGTNGKTSTCHILSEIFKRSGIKTGRIGTIGNYIGDERMNSSLTTPGLFELYELMSKMIYSGVKILIMEVSAHAIEQKRVEGIYFNALIFTNCTEDHLDYFSDMSTYRNVKRSIFSHEIAEYFVINVDDELGREIYTETETGAFSYGILNPSDVFALDVKVSDKGIEYLINAMDYVERIHSGIFGEFNVYNSLAAITSALILGVNVKVAVETLQNIKPIEGRMELLDKYKERSVFIDYAHTPDGLEKMLLSLKKICKKNLICVFGCGGNREREKRFIMGKISGQIADFTVITDDNPRYEEPEDIRREIENGVKSETDNYVNIGDRYSAIRYAIEKMDNGDILVIAGKGAETYQEISGVKYDFSDKNTAERILEELRGKV